MIPVGFIFSVPLFIFGNLWYTNLYIIFYFVIYLNYLVFSWPTGALPLRLTLCF